MAIQRFLERTTDIRISEEHHGPPGARTPGWAAREALVASGLATPDDLACWEAAFVRTDGMEERPTIFLPLFCAIGRRPA